MATGWKRAAEILLARSGLPKLMQRRNAPSTAVLAYHNIVPTGERLAGDASLHVDQRTFADQLDLMLETYEVVSLSELRDTTPKARSRIVITFDDAYYGTMTAGLEELRNRGLPATVFVPPGLLGAPGFWWDLLAPKGGGPLPEGLRSHCLEKLRGQGEKILTWAEEHGLEVQELPEHAQPADEPTLFARGESPGISLGSHTWSHPNLAALPAAEIEQQLARSKQWLQAKSNGYVDWLAYPYGLHYEDALVAAQGQFAGAALIRGGLAELHGRWPSPPHATPRLNVPRGLTLEGLALRLAGLLA